MTVPVNHLLVTLSGTSRASILPTPRDVIPQVAKVLQVTENTIPLGSQSLELVLDLLEHEVLYKDIPPVLTRRTEV